MNELLPIIRRVRRPFIVEPEPVPPVVAAPAPEKIPLVEPKKKAEPEKSHDNASEN